MNNQRCCTELLISTGTLGPQAGEMRPPPPPLHAGCAQWLPLQGAPGKRAEKQWLHRGETWLMEPQATVTSYVDTPSLNVMGQTRHFLPNLGPQCNRDKNCGQILIEGHSTRSPTNTLSNCQGPKKPRGVWGTAPVERSLGDLTTKCLIPIGTLEQEKIRCK